MRPIWYKKYDVHLDFTFDDLPWKSQDFSEKVISSSDLTEVRPSLGVHSSQRHRCHSEPSGLKLRNQVLKRASNLEDEVKRRDSKKGSQKGEANSAFQMLQSLKSDRKSEALRRSSCIQGIHGKSIPSKIKSARFHWELVAGSSQLRL